MGEPRPPGIVGRILSPSGGLVTHFDRFILPSIAQVEYRIGTENHFHRDQRDDAGHRFSHTHLRGGQFQASPASGLARKALLATARASHLSARREDPQNAEPKHIRRFPAASWFASTEDRRPRAAHLEAHERCGTRATFRRPRTRVKIV